MQKLEDYMGEEAIEIETNENIGGVDVKDHEEVYIPGARLVS